MTLRHFQWGHRAGELFCPASECLQTLDVEGFPGVAPNVVRAHSLLFGGQLPVLLL